MSSTPSKEQDIKGDNQWHFLLFWFFNCSLWASFFLFQVWFWCYIFTTSRTCPSSKGWLECTWGYRMHWQPLIPYHIWPFHIPPMSCLDIFSALALFHPSHIQDISAWHFSGFTPAFIVHPSTNRFQCWLDCHCASIHGNILAYLKDRLVLSVLLPFHSGAPDHSMLMWLPLF